MSPSIVSKSKPGKIPVASWTIVDVVGLNLCFWIGFLLFCFALFALEVDSKKTIVIVRYVASLAGIFLTLFWIKKRYGLSKEALGLSKGEAKASSLVFIGIVTALIYILLIRITPLWRNSPALDHLTFSYVQILLAPISINGFATFVLGPIREEIMYRGFMYGYLRKKLGVLWGLILQALFFSLSHPGYIHGNAFYLIGVGFMIGIILGLLYEKTGRLYPSNACHGMINYLSIVLSVHWS